MNMVLGPLLMINVTMIVIIAALLLLQMRIIYFLFGISGGPRSYKVVPDLITLIFFIVLIQDSVARYLR